VTPTVSDYDRVGGAPTIRAVVDRFYDLVLADGELAGYFTGLDLARIKRHQVLLLSQVLGGPVTYDGRDLADAHRHLRVSGAHYDRVGQYLTGLLWKSDVDTDIIFRVADTLAAVRPQIVAAPADAPQTPRQRTGRRSLAEWLRRPGRNSAQRVLPSDGPPQERDGR
jgi:hemoglobin